MKAVTLKNIPDSVYAGLKEVASAHRRSVNSEILWCLEQYLSVYLHDANERLGTARKLRKLTAKSPITEKELNQLKNTGRK
jgi:antitoxin FitA